MKYTDLLLFALAMVLAGIAIGITIAPEDRVVVKETTPVILHGFDEAEIIIKETPTALYRQYILQEEITINRGTRCELRVDEEREWVDCLGEEFEIDELHLFDFEPIK